MTYGVSTVIKCITYADDANVLYTGDDVLEMCKIVSNKLSLNISFKKLYSYKKEKDSKLSHY